MMTPDTTMEVVFAKIGRLCMVWASMDSSANKLLTEILRVSDDQTLCIATQIDSVSGRTKLLKNLAYTTAQSAEWKEDLVALLNYIDGHLAPKRNRIIHDAWDFQQEEPAQLDRRAKVLRPQAREPLKLSTEARSTVTAAHVERVTTSASHCSVALLSAWADLSVRRELKRPHSGFSALRVAMQDVMPRHRLDLKSDQSGPDQAPA